MLRRDSLRGVYVAILATSMAISWYIADRDRQGSKGPGPSQQSIHVRGLRRRPEVRRGVRRTQPGSTSTCESAKAGPFQRCRVGSDQVAPCRVGKREFSRPDVSG